MIFITILSLFAVIHLNGKRCMQVKAETSHFTVDSNNNYETYLYQTSIYQDQFRKYIVDLLWRGTLMFGARNNDLNNETKQCLNALKLYFEAAIRKQESWAMKMYDASSSIQSGFLTGNIQDMGSYDECVEIENLQYAFKGQFCTIVLNDTNSPLQEHISLRNIPVSYSICVPSSCSPLMTQNIINEAAARVYSNISFSASEQHCFTQDYIPFSGADWFAIIVFTSIIGLSIAATVYEIYLQPKDTDSKTHKMLISFSLYKNSQQLLHVTKNQDLLDCLYGLRFLIMVWIILIHRFSQLHTQPAMGIFKWNSIIQHWSRAIITNGFICVDSFLAMSGILLSYTFLKKFEKQKHFSITTFYIHRYIRLTPALAGLVLFYATLSDRLCDGPMCPLYNATIKKPCVTNWWASLLYINNYYDSDNMCAIQTWYTSVDMQLIWLSPILLYPLMYKSWTMPYLLGGLTAISMIVSVVQPYYNNVHAGYFIVGRTEDHRIFLENYVYTHTRIASWLYGFATGIYMYKFKRSPKEISKRTLYLGWTITGLTLFGVIFSILPFQQETYEYSPIKDSLYKSLHRHAWALASCWLIFACANGYGGIVNKFLSWGPIFQPLGRLSYCIYLTHILILKLQMGTQRTPINFVDNSKITVAFGDILGSILSAAVLYLLFEAPGCTLERYFLGRTKVDSLPKPDSVIKLEKHVTIQHE